ncbi:hypothetical protein A1D29_10245 [Pasteurellaceae bacterium Orientalotternb1]|nr:hypothetical protein A1D29_10245 [Pasteurellaceae bacterium Orientalotternb1]
MFRLVKHYYDLIDQNGNAFIIYDAKLHFYGLKIPYSSIIFSDASGNTKEQSCLSPLNVSSFKFFQPKLALEGEYQPQQQFKKLTLFQQDQKQLEWDCHSPKTWTEVIFNQQRYQGFGYAESLSLNFFPWLLPIDELYWGRFVSESHSIVWIEWRGKQPFKQLIYNQHLSHSFELAANQLVTAQFRLDFDEPIMIKNSPLLSVIKSVPFLSFFVNKRFTDSQEIKWKSRATLHIGDTMEKGWVLYEKVIWKS